MTMSLSLCVCLSVCSSFFSLEHQCIRNMMFQGYLKDVLRAFQHCSKGVLNEILRVFQACFMGVSRVLQGSFKGVSRKF